MEATTAAAPAEKTGRTKWGGPSLRPGQSRDPESGLRLPASHRPGARTLWRRLTDNREAMLQLGGHAGWATVLGRLLMTGAITQSQYWAGERFAELAGRFDRFEPHARRTVGSPSYERGRGREDEVERRSQDGTLRSYERAAKKARKNWLRAQGCLPDAGRDMVENVAIFGQELLDAHHRDFAAMLTLLVDHFGFKAEVGEGSQGPLRRSVARRTPPEAAKSVEAVPA